MIESAATVEAGHTDRRERRRLARMPGDPLLMGVLAEAGPLVLRVLNTTLLGAQLELFSGDLSLLSGGVLDLIFRRGDRLLSRLRARLIWMEPELRRAGIEFASSAAGRRLYIHPDLQATLYADHPWRASSVIEGRLTSVAAGKLYWVVPETARDMLPGITLRGTILSPRGQHVIDAFVSAVTVLPRQRLELELTVADFKEVTSSLLAILLPVAADNEDFASRLESLRALGISLRSAGSAVHVERCSLDGGAYQDALEVRLAAYRAAAKIPEDARPSDMRDLFDNASIILVAYIGSAAVGTIRLVSAVAAGNRLPCMRFYGADLKKFAGSSGLMEFSRLAVIPQLQRSDLVITLMEAAFEHFLLGGFRVAFLLATPASEPLYKRLGAKCVSRGAAHDTVSGETLALLRMTIKEMRNASHMRILVWDRIAGPPLRLFRRHGLFPASLAEILVFPLRRVIERRVMRLPRLRRRLQRCR